DVQLQRRTAISIGFDGSRWRDTTGIVVTHLEKGWQKRWALWEPGDDEPVPEDEVIETIRDLFRTYTVTRLYGDPAAGWDGPLAQLAGEFGPKRVVFFYTDSRNLRRTAVACRTYAQAIRAG